MKPLKLNPFVQAGIGLSFALLWSCPTLAALTDDKNFGLEVKITGQSEDCLLYTSPSPRDATLSRMPSSA